MEHFQKTVLPCYLQKVTSKMDDDAEGTYFDSGLHQDGGGIVDSLASQREHRVVSLLLGPCNVLVYLLENINSSTYIKYLQFIVNKH